MAGGALLGFTLPKRGARGRVVRLERTLSDILATHAYSDAIATLVGEALVLAALLGDLLRPGEGQLTLQARGDGPVKLLVADWRDGEVRAYAAQELDRRFADRPGERPSLGALLGKGYLAITLDQTLAAERYQGIVDLGDQCLEEAAGTYFSTSEQVPTVVRLAAGRDSEGRWTAGGLVLQSLSRGEEGAARLHVDGVNPDWAHVATLAGSVRPAELVDPALPLDDLLWRLFHEEQVRVLPERPVTRGCRCSEAHILTVLSQFPEEERREMRNAQGQISVDCEFCSRQFLLTV
jgi:molecular chaperone Hsp33